jgi:hypothetical protein
MSGNARTDGWGEQERQIEALWDAVKILRFEAEWHMREGPTEDDTYAIWSGKAWAAYAFVDELIGQRLGLLASCLHAGANVEVGELNELPAMLPLNPSLPENMYVGPFFSTRRGRELLANAQKCDHGASQCWKTSVKP